MKSYLHSEVQLLIVFLQHSAKRIRRALASTNRVSGCSFGDAYLGQLLSEVFAIVSVFPIFVTLSAL